MRKTQFISIDGVASLAVIMADLSEESIRLDTEKEKLAQSCVSEFQQIIITSKFDIDIAKVVKDALATAQHPILIYPEEAELSEALNLLIKTNVILIPAKIDSLASISFSVIIKSLETMLISGEEHEVSLDEEDIFAMLQPHSINRLYLGNGKTTQEAMDKATAQTTDLKKSQSASCLFHINSDISFEEISETTMDLMYKIDDDTDFCFQTRVDDTRSDVDVILSVCNYVDLNPAVQEQVDEEPTYLRKASVIVDSYEDGAISMDEANEIAEKNNIDIADLKIVHGIAYATPDYFLKLLRNLREDIDDTQRNELIAQAVLDDYVDIDVLDKLVLIYNLCEDWSGIDKALFEIELFQLPALDIRISETRTTVIMQTPKSLDEMNKSERKRSCYQHCCLKYVMGEKMSNQSFRERLGLPDSRAGTEASSRIIREVLTDNMIRLNDEDSKSKRYAKYVPFWS